MTEQRLVTPEDAQLQRIRLRTMTTSALTGALDTKDEDINFLLDRVAALRSQVQALTEEKKRLTEELHDFVTDKLELEQELKLAQEALRKIVGIIKSTASVKMATKLSAIAEIAAAAAIQEGK